MTVVESAIFAAVPIPPLAVDLGDSKRRDAVAAFNAAFDGAATR